MATINVKTGGAKVVVNGAGGVVVIGRAVRIVAKDVYIADAGGYYSSSNVEGALQEVGAILANPPTPLVGGIGIEVAGGEINLGLPSDPTPVATTGTRTVVLDTLRIVNSAGTAGAVISPEDALCEFTNDSLSFLVTQDISNARSYQSTIQPLSVVSGEIAWNMALGQRAKVTLTGNATLLNPTNATVAFPDLEVLQDGTGGHVLSFGSNFVLPVGYVAPPTTANTYTLYHFQLRSDGKFAVVATHYAT
jgi:hypothetical protein